MTFLDLHISGFGRFSEYELSFAPGVNILYGHNEAGKTTLHTFLRAMLFGLDRRPGKGGKKSPYESCRPWTGGPFGGTLRIRCGGRIYRIDRDFDLPGDGLTVTCEDTGRQEAQPEEFIRSALLGLTETGYINTISIGQLKAGPGKGMSEALSRYYGNLRTTGDADLNAQRALSYLAEQRHMLRERMFPDAEKNYAAAVGRIKNLEEGLRDPANNNDLLYYQGVREELKASIGAKAAEEQELSERIEKNRRVLQEAGFHTDQDILSSRGEAEKLYTEYAEVLARMGSSGQLYGTVLPGLFLLLAVLCAAGIVLLSGKAVIPLALLIAAFAGAAAVLRSRAAADRKRVSALSEELGSILLKYTGNEAVSFGSMDAFRQSMDGYSRLFSDTEGLEGAVQKAHEEWQELNRKLSQCAEDIENQQNIRMLVEQRLQELNALKNQAQELRHETEENARLMEERDAIDLAAERIGELSESIGKSLGTYLNAEAGKLITQFTDGAYHGIEAGNGTSVYLHTKDRMVSISEVSSGTMDQVWLALRLAAVKLVQGERAELPLLFDDSFALYDDDRMKNALQALTRAYPGQLLIFSCHRREAAAMDAFGARYSLKAV